MLTAIPPPILDDFVLYNDRVEALPRALPSPAFLAPWRVCLNELLRGDSRKNFETMRASRACVGTKCSATGTRLQERLNIFRNALVDLQVSSGRDAFVPTT